MKKKLKVAIFTLQSYNYGGRMQNYAVNLVLEKLSYEPINVRNDRISAKEGIKNWLHDLFIKDRFSYFRTFNKKMGYTKRYINRTEVSNFDDCHAIIVGSDQVWNTTFPFVSVNSFLPFRHLRKIAFSASFGVDSIPFNQEIVVCLNDFKALSVREEAGAKIIRDFTGRNAAVLIDPTMIITHEEWRKVSKKPKGAKEGYILTYFLSPKCDKAKEKLEEIRGGWRVYELLDIDDKVAGIAGPSEFLWLFDHAEMILTDSFHACIFSFLFNKPFIVYDRNWNEGNMNSRLETLLKKFNLERKYANSGLENDLWEHDYTKGYQQLEIERQKAMDFLQRALED